MQASENGLPAEIDDLSLADPPSLDNQLSQFRIAWQREISDRQPSSSESSARNSPIDGSLNERNVKERQLSKLDKEERVGWIIHSFMYWYIYFFLVVSSSFLEALKIGSFFVYSQSSSCGLGFRS